MTLLAAMGICLLSQPAEAGAPDVVPAWSGKWQPWIETEGKLGSRRSLGEIDLFIPISQDDDTLFFSDLRLRMDDHSSREGNFGIGLRQMLEDGWNVGGYGYFDRRRSPTGHTYGQITLGAELLGRDFDLRANSYWPVGSRENLIGESRDAPVAVLNGTQLQMVTPEGVQTMERSIGGFDAEIGWRVPVFDVGSDFDLRFYAGGYRFGGSDVEAVYGPRLRAEFVSFDTPGLWEGARVTLGAEWQHDDVRGSQGFASLRLRIPLQLGPGRPDRPASLQERRMTAAVVRDIDIVTGTRSQPLPEIVEGAALVATGASIDTVVQLDAAAVADLPAELAHAGANSLVILDGAVNVTTANVALQQGQVLAGGGTQLALRGTGSGKTAMLTLPGGTGEIAVQGWSIQAANNSAIVGLDLSRTGATAGRGTIFVSNASNVAILDNTITSQTTGADHVMGIVLTANTENVVISGNRISVQTPGGAMTQALGISVQPGAGSRASLVVSGNDLTISGGADSTASVFALQDVTFDTTRSTGNTGNAGCTFMGGVTGSVMLNGAAC